MSSLFRILQIFFVLRRYRIDEYLYLRKNVKPLKWVKYVFFWIPAKDKDKDIAYRFRQTLEDLGPIWIKLGQLLSIQDDFVSQSITEELKLLQDKVTPFSDAQAREIIAEQLGVAPEQIFSQISSTPLATASIAQVYAATLNLPALQQLKQEQPNLTSLEIFSLEDYPTEQEQVEVVIKIIRPKIAHTVKQELHLIRRLFDFIAYYFDKSNRLRGNEIVNELEHNFQVELNLTTEAGNGQTLRDHWYQSPLLYIPKTFCANREILVMERIYGTSIHNAPALAEQGVDLKLLAERGVEIFFTQLLKFNFFHADMHPGNIFIDISKPEDPSYIAIDFGIVGSLNHQDLKYLVGNLIAFFKQDYRRIAELHINSGWIRGKVDINEVERRIRHTLDPLFNKPLSEIRFSLVLKNLFIVAREFNMVVQPQLILLEKTLVYIEAMGRAIYPQLNLWETAKPILEQWFREEYSISTQSKQFVKALPDVMKSVGQLPDDLYKFFDNQQRILHKLQDIEDRVNNASRRMISLLLGLFMTMFAGFAIFGLVSGSSLIHLVFLILTIITGLFLLVYFLFG